MISENKKNKRMVLIDSNALIHRAFHALPPLSKRDGTPTNAVYGYALTLLSVIKKMKPNYVVATFDLAGPTFRHNKFDQYKATRKKAPDELYQQIPMVKEMLKAFGIPIFEKKGFEADDIIGTIAKTIAKTKNGQFEKIIVTGDLDTLQLIDENIKVFTLRRGIKDIILYDIEKVKQRYGIEPSQMVDFKALRGDISDNIPGVKGIGEKTAIELILKYKTLNGVYKNIENIQSLAIRRKLKEGKKMAYMSYELAKIKTNVPIGFKLESCSFFGIKKEAAKEFFKKMEFFSLLKKLENEEDSKLRENNGKLNVKNQRKGRNSRQKEEEIFFKLEIIKNQIELEKVFNDLETAKEIGISFLIQGERLKKMSIEGVGIATENSKSFFIPRVFLTEKFWEKILGKEKRIIFGDNFKSIFSIWELRNQKHEKEISWRCEYNFFDVILMAYLLRAGSVKDDLEEIVFNQWGKTFKHRVTKKGQSNLLLDNNENTQLNVAEKAIWNLKLGKELIKELELISNEQKTERVNFLVRRKGLGTLKSLFEKVEQPLIMILAKMEAIGIKVDRRKLQDASQEAEKEVKRISEEIFNLVGEEFNLNSPIQLAKVLYEKLQLPTSEIKKGKMGFSTDADQLRKIRNFHPIISLIENYRELFKIKTTYADNLPLLIDEDGRLRTNFNQVVTATGRLSSSNPNLQNIPKKGKLAKVIREAFVAETGKVFVSADYSQIDLRVAAHLSEDAKLIESFQKNKDIHRITAAWVNGVSEEEVTEKQRNEAKALNFGVLYGMGTYGFMRDSGVSKERAEFFINQYMEKFSGLKNYLEITRKIAHQRGYVETELGRRRYIANLNVANYQLRSAAERMAVNFPIQGLAADIVKLAMVEIEKKMKKNEIILASFLLQIHDELIFEIEKEKAEEFSSQIKEVMEKVYKLKVPLRVEIKIGNNWQEVS